jgi:hypothetical protein
VRERHEAQQRLPIAALPVKMLAAIENQPPARLEGDLGRARRSS